MARYAPTTTQRAGILPCCARRYVGMKSPVLRGLASTRLNPITGRSARSKQPAHNDTWPDREATRPPTAQTEHVRPQLGHDSEMMREVNGGLEAHRRGGHIVDQSDRADHQGDWEGRKSRRKARRNDRQRRGSHRIEGSCDVQKGEAAEN